VCIQCKIGQKKIAILQIFAIAQLTCRDRMSTTGHRRLVFGIGSLWLLEPLMPQSGVCFGRSESRRLIMPLREKNIVAL